MPGGEHSDELAARRARRRPADAVASARLGEPWRIAWRGESAQFPADLQTRPGLRRGGLPFALVAAMLQRSWRVCLVAAVFSALLIVAGFLTVSAGDPQAPNAFMPLLPVPQLHAGQPSCGLRPVRARMERAGRAAPPPGGSTGARVSSAGSRRPRPGEIPGSQPGTPKGQPPRNLSGPRTGRDRQLWSRRRDDRGGAEGPRPAAAAAQDREQPGGPLHELRPASHRAHPRPSSSGCSPRSATARSTSSPRGAARPDSRRRPAEPAAAAVARRPPRPSCAGWPGKNQVLTSMIGLGYYGTRHPGGDPPQPAGESRLVHRLHAVPAGDLAGQARGAAELPDDGRRPHRAAGGRRLACWTRRPRRPRR